jgi:phospholipid/cholesterol/gamma-HCH transport system permease protein
MSTAEIIKGDASCALLRQSGRAILQLAGRWTVFTIEGVERGVTRLAAKDRIDALDLAAVEELDTSGAGEILQLSRRLAPKGDSLPLENAQPHHARLLELVARQKIKLQAKRHVPWVMAQLILIGESSVEYLQQLRNLLAFLGQTIIVGFAVLRSPRHMRMTAVINLMDEVWVRALPIVGTLVFLIGVVLAYQGVEQLKRFGAQSFTVDMVGLSVLREIGVLLTAIIVAGRSGSAFTAQIGTMQVNQEVDAMRTIGLNPIEWLVLPRILALVLCMPLLAFWGDMTGLLGGAVACIFYLDFTLVQFFDRLRDTVGIWHFYTGMIKAPVFGFIIAAIGCFEGLQVRGSAESVGQLTTRSVVESIFCVIVLDAVFSIIFLLANV